MRALLDTNIIIYRENKRITNYSIGHLFKWLDKLRYDKIIHPLSIEEISRYNYDDPQEAITLKLDAYNIMKTTVPLDATVDAKLSPNDRDRNDQIDTALLNEVYLNRVDVIITEDKRMINKAICLGISDKIFNINSFISYATTGNPLLVEYKVLAVKKTYFGNVDLNNAFFNSFRTAYDGFDKWFASKCDEEAYICQNDTGDILGFLYLKTEDESENYHDIMPPFAAKKRLKVGTFKVESTGFRLGERFIKIIFDNAIERSVDEVYITLFENLPELTALYELLVRWGFVQHGVKTGNDKSEKVLVKKMKCYDSKLTARQNYPNLLYNKQKFILPIFPQYHTALLPDSMLNNENEVDIMANEPQRYALQKVYISWAPERNVQPGDIVLFYRMGNEGSNKKYTSVLTTITIVESIICNFSSEKEFLHHCQNRSVFSDNDLKRFWTKNKNNLKILKFIFVKSLVKRLTLEYMWNNNIVAAPNGPRSFMRLSDEQFDAIVSDSQTNLDRYWRII